MHQPRAGLRIPVKLPVEIRWKSHAGKTRRARGQTSNISGSGLYLSAPLRLGRKTPITFTVLLPAEVTKVALELRCQGRVVRWSRPGELPGMGAIIDNYELRPAHRKGSPPPKGKARPR
jgi:hypothetical protein